MKKLLLLFCIVLVFSSCGTENVVTNDTEYEFSSETTTEKKEYVINKDTKKYHIPSCSYALDIKEENKEYANMDFIISREYTPCSRCIK